MRWLREQPGARPGHRRDPGPASTCSSRSPSSWCFSFNKPRASRNLVWNAVHPRQTGRTRAAPRRVRRRSVHSLEIGLIATVVATVLGTLIAFALVRHRFRGRAPTNLLDLPADGHARDRPGRRLLALFLQRPRAVPARLRDDRHRAHHVLHLLRRRHRQGPAGRPWTRGSRRRRMDLYADRVRRRSGRSPSRWSLPGILGAALLALLAVVRRLHHHQLQRRHRRRRSRCSSGASPSAASRRRSTSSARSCSSSRWRSCSSAISCGVGAHRSSRSTEAEQDPCRHRPPGSRTPPGRRSRASATSPSGSITPDRPGPARAARRRPRRRPRDRRRRVHRPVGRRPRQAGRPGAFRRPRRGRRPRGRRPAATAGSAPRA